MALGDDADDEVEQGPVDGVTDRGDGAFGGEGQGHGACAVIRRGPVLDQDPLGNAVPFEGPERIFRTGSLSVEDAVDRLGSPLVRGWHEPGDAEMAGSTETYVAVCLQGSFVSSAGASGACRCRRNFP